MNACIWFIAGPTASGKSSLALRLAQAIDGEVVNADSTQIYADLRLLTARPPPSDEARAPHHLYGVADAAEVWSVGRWLRSALDVIGDIRARGKPVIIVGGTGLYFRALTRGLADIPPVAKAVREEARARFERLGEAAFRGELAQVDPTSAARIAPGDRQRLTRAFEVWAASGRAISAWQADTASALEDGSWRGMVLQPPRDELYRRCDARLAAMARDGALDEVAALLSRDLSPSLPAMKAVGVAAFAAQLKGEASADETLARAQAETRRYAKRQITWFRHQTPDWPRVDASDADGQWRQFQSFNPALTAAP